MVEPDNRGERGNRKGRLPSSAALLERVRACVAALLMVQRFFNTASVLTCTPCPCPLSLHNLLNY